MNAPLNPPLPLDRDGITRLVHRFYDSVRADPLLAPVFEPPLAGHWDEHLARMVDFWCTACKIGRSFRGNVYDKHMALPGIRLPHLLRWLTLWQQHSNALFAADDAAHLQDVAVGVARVMHLGWFGDLPARADLEALLAQQAEPAAA